MTKVKILALLVGVVLLLTIPATASAQRLPPHVFVGAMIDGAAAVDGTVVTAWVDGAQVASATVSGGAFALIVDQGDASFAGKTVSFQIDGVGAIETMTWMQGGGDEISLTSGAMMEAGEVVTIDLGELNNSGQSGTATLTEMGNMTQVVLSLSAGALQTELVHIHSGQCGDTLGGVDYALTSFVGGSGASTTTVEATLAMLKDGNHAINSHDASDPSNYTACANIPSSAMAMEPTPMAMAPGATGVPGARGPAGPRGSAGNAGSGGAEGDTGPAGAAGRAGAAGPAGSAGAKGDAGSAGATGPAGPAGAGGPAGAEGDDGSNVLGIIALILAIVAIVGAGGAYLMGRRT